MRNVSTHHTSALTVTRSIPGAPLTALPASGDQAQHHAENPVPPTLFCRPRGVGALLPPPQEGWRPEAPRVWAALCLQRGPLQSSSTWGRVP